MDADRDALLDHYRRTRAELLAAIAGLADGDLEEPSLDGWSVKDHLAHLALWDEIRAAEVERISAGHASAWRMTEEQDAAFNAIGHEIRRPLAIAQVRWELVASRQRLLDAIAAATPAGLDAARYGEAGLLSPHEALHTSWIRRWRDARGR